MADTSIGKQFEAKFKENFQQSLPDAFIMRLYDITMGYKSIDNYCDFICFDGSRLYMIDCKAHKGASLPFDAFPQYEKLVNIRHKNIITGVVLWLYEKDKVYFIPTYTVEKAKKAGMKSINPTKVSRSKYLIFDIPSVKLRTFMNSNYQILKTVPDYLTYKEGETTK